MEKSRILIVEDEGLNALFLEKKLISIGYDVVGVVSSGEEALVLSDELRPDIVLMDIILDGEMDGIEASREIKEKFNVPIIYVSAHSDLPTLERARETEAYGYIVKPAKAEEVSAAIEVALYKNKIEMKLKESEFRYKELSEDLDKKLRESEYRHLWNVYSQSTFPTLVMDKHGKIVDYNRAMETLTGYAHEEMPDCNIWILKMFVDESFRSLVLERALNPESGSNRGEFVVTAKNGVYRYVVFSVYDILHEGEFTNLRIVQGEDITERKQVEETLRLSEERFRTLAKAAPVGIYLTDPDGDCVYVNDRWQEMAGLGIEEARGKGWVQGLHEKDRDLIGDSWYKMIESKGVWGLEFRFQNKEGLITWVYGVAVEQVDKDGSVTGIIGINIDITMLKESEFNLIDSLAESIRLSEQLEISNREKETLLKEIHHRVKNNMQILSSLLGLQSSYIDNEKALGIMKETERRIRSMALIHEKLYRSGDLSKIDFNDYIKTITEELSEFYRGQSLHIDIEVQVKDLFLDIVRAIPCALIINELLTNSYKYAFLEKREGVITIHFEKQTGGVFVLTIADNGTGLPEEFNINEIESLGLQLVLELTKQLKGKLETFNKTGTTFVITFPVT
ncbi:MAG: PAS domain S-box protein [bacterium]|nr:PAS domain S-box protein [bacterium]